MPSRDLKVTLVGEDRTGRAWDSAGKGAGKLVGVLAGAGLAAGAAFGGGLVGAMNTEAANDKLAASLGLTAEESKKAGDIAGRLYAGAYGDSLSGVNAAVAGVVSSFDGLESITGETGPVIEALTTKALDLASAFEIDVTRATQVAGQAVTSGLAADGAQAMDLLTASMQKVPAAVREDLLDAVDEYGPFMQDLGLQGERAFGLLVGAAEKGMFGIDKTGDALKEFTIRATDMSTASKVGFDALGVSQEDMTRKLLAGGDTAAQAFSEIVGGLQKIKDPAKQSQAALALFGTPLEDLSVTEIPKFLGSLTSAQTSLKDTAGAAERMGDTLNDNASTNIESFKRQATQAFVRTLGGKVLPFVSQAAAVLATEFGPALQAAGHVLTDDIIPAFRSAADFISHNGTTFTVVASIIAAVLIPHFVALGVAATVNAAKTAAAWVMTQAAAAKAAVTHSVSVVKIVAGWAAMAAKAAVHAAVVVGGWVLMGAQSLVQAARMAAAWVIAMGPVGWVIAAVVGLTVLIYKNWDKIVAATKAAWDWVAGKVSAAWKWIKDSVSSGVAGVVSFVQGLPGRITGALGNLGSTLWNAGIDLIAGFINGIKRKAGDIIRVIRETITDRLPGFVKKALGIQSPSKVFAALGAQTAEGFAVGIDRERGAAQSAMSRLLDVADVAGMNVGGAGYINGRLAATAGGAPREVNININVTGTTDPRAAALEIRRELLALQRSGMNLGLRS